MNDEIIGNALIELADIANCISGDFHQLHFNVYGCEFDTMHKKVLKKYYEEAANDYDEFAEWSRAYGVCFPSPNKSAERIGYVSYDMQQPVNKEQVVCRSKEIMELLQDKYLTMFKILNQIDDCSRAIGIANFIQSRLEYWSKEYYYFNKSREVM